MKKNIVNHNPKYYDSLDTSSHQKSRDIAFYPFVLQHIKDIIQSIRQRYLSHHKGDIYWLDVGCGRGNLCQVAQELGWQYCGVDISDNNIQFCAKNYPKANFILADFVSLSSSELPWRPNLISFISSLHHFPDWRAAIDRSLNLLQPGGVIYVEHEPTRLFSSLFKAWVTCIRRYDVKIIKGVEIHWFAKPSILPTDLPNGEVDFHCDFLPGVRHFKLRTRNPFLGKFLANYRKIIPKNPILLEDNPR